MGPINTSLPEWDQVIVDIKDYVFHHEITSSQAYENARQTVLDALGCAVKVLTTSPELTVLLGPHMPGTIVPNGFRLPGTSFVLDPVKGAFDLGSMIRFLDFNDAFGGMDWGHPSDNLGAILAVSDWLSQSGQTPNGPPLTIRTLLTAMIKAYEIQGSFSSFNSFNKLGLDHTILVKLGSTAVVSWLMGLSEDQTMGAISHVFMDGCPLRIFRAGSNTIPRKGWAAGDACMRAVQLCLLTAAGQPGSPTVLTMPRWGFYANTWRGNKFTLPPTYESFVMENIFWKLVPAEGHGITGIDAALMQSKILRERGLKPHRDIKRLVIRATRPTVDIIDKPGPFYNAADRDHSLQYMVAVTFLKGGPPVVEDYLDSSPWASDENVVALSSKFDISEEPQFTREYLDESRRGEARPCGIGMTVVLQDDSELEEVVVKLPLGCSNNPATMIGLRSKFQENMKALFTSEEVEKIVELAKHDDLPISALVDLFRR